MRNIDPNLIHPSLKPELAASAAQQRLLMAALRLFAEKGFANTSIRDLAQNAKVNISAISYYFGDKKGLYKAAFTHTHQCGGPDELWLADFSAPESLNLTDFLRKLLQGFTEPLKLGELAAWRVRLQMREMIEPTGLWEHEIQFKIAPMLAALQARLIKELQLKAVDDSIRRLAFSIVGLGVHVMVSRDVVTQLMPNLTGSTEAIDSYTEQLVIYAQAMVESERLVRSKKL